MAAVDADGGFALEVTRFDPTLATDLGLDLGRPAQWSSGWTTGSGGRSRRRRKRRK
jgi:hypothetical protein